MKKKLIAILIMISAALTLTSCEKEGSIIENAYTETESTAMFERHTLGDGYSILVDKETGVCYLEYEKTSLGGFSYYGITVMLTADGTPKIWEEE